MLVKNCDESHFTISFLKKNHQLVVQNRKSPTKQRNPSFPNKDFKDGMLVVVVSGCCRVLGSFEGSHLLPRARGQSSF